MAPPRGLVGANAANAARLQTNAICENGVVSGLPNCAAGPNANPPEVRQVILREVDYDQAIIDDDNMFIDSAGVFNFVTGLSYFSGQ